MRTRIAAALAMIIALTAFAPVPFPKPKKKPTVNNSIEGVWEIVERSNSSGKGGKAAKINSLKMSLKIEEDKWTFLRHMPDGTFSPSISYHLKIDKSKTPIWFDLRRNATAPNLSMKGIIKIDGDTGECVYTIGGAERPADFTLSGVRQHRMKLKRTSSMEVKK